jgi:hypothetical protein
MYTAVILSSFVFNSSGNSATPGLLLNSVDPKDSMMILDQIFELGTDQTLGISSELFILSGSYQHTLYDGKNKKTPLHKASSFDCSGA